MPTPSAQTVPSKLSEFKLKYPIVINALRRENPESPQLYQINRVVYDGGDNKIKSVCVGRTYRTFPITSILLTNEKLDKMKEVHKRMVDSVFDKDTGPAVSSSSFLDDADSINNIILDDLSTIASSVQQTNTSKIYIHNSTLYIPQSAFGLESISAGSLLNGVYTKASNSVFFKDVDIMKFLSIRQWEVSPAIYMSSSVTIKDMEELQTTTTKDVTVSGWIPFLFIEGTIIPLISLNETERTSVDDLAYYNINNRNYIWFNSMYARSTQKEPKYREILPHFIINAVKGTIPYIFPNTSIGLTGASQSGKTTAGAEIRKKLLINRITSPPSIDINIAKEFNIKTKDYKPANTQFIVDDKKVGIHLHWLVIVNEHRELYLRPDQVYRDLINELNKGRHDEKPKKIELDYSNTSIKKSIQDDVIYIVSSVNSVSASYIRSAIRFFVQDLEQRRPGQKNSIFVYVDSMTDVAAMKDPDIASGPARQGASSSLRSNSMEFTRIPAMDSSDLVTINIFSLFNIPEQGEDWLAFIAGAYHTVINFIDRTPTVPRTRIPGDIVGAIRQIALNREVSTGYGLAYSLDKIKDQEGNNQ